MLFHDTRMAADLRNMLDVMLAYQNEIGDVWMNRDQSNISGFRRKTHEPAYDWAKTEGQSRWDQGLEPPPANWPSLLEK